MDSDVPGASEKPPGSRSAGRGSGKAKGERGTSKRPERSDKPRRKPETGRSSPGSRRSTRKRQSTSPGKRVASSLQQQIAEAAAGHEHLESMIESMGRQLFTDTKKRCALKERLDSDVEELEQLRHEIEELGRVTCPVCNERFSKREIQSHVDSCLSSMLVHIEKTVEQVPGVQRALRPRSEREKSKSTDYYDGSDDGYSLTSFDLEGSAAPDVTVWNNPLTSGRKSSGDSRPGESSPVVGGSSVRQQREERRRLRQEQIPNRVPRLLLLYRDQSPSDKPLELSSIAIPCARSDPAAESDSTQLLGLGSHREEAVQLASRSTLFQHNGHSDALGITVDDTIEIDLQNAQARAPPNRGAMHNENKSWADRHPGLAKLVASADDPLARRVSPPRMWEAVSGVAAAPTSAAAPDRATAIHTQAETPTRHGDTTVVDVRTGGRDTVAAIKPSHQFNAQYWLEQSDNPRDWSTASTVKAAPEQSSAPSPGAAPAMGAQLAEILPESMTGQHSLTAEPPLLLPPPPLPLELTVHANNSGQADQWVQRSVAVELRDLQVLQAEGILTTKEFEAQKKVVLERGLGPSENNDAHDSAHGASGKPYAWKAQLDSVGSGA